MAGERATLVRCKLYKALVLGRESVGEGLLDGDAGVP